ncbi:MAG: hypothetical protein ACK46X_10745 [Candidatus Sericytochromatia bacterium]
MVALTERSATAMEKVDVLRACVALLDAPGKRSPQAQDALMVLVEAAREGLLQNALQDISRN